MTNIMDCSDNESEIEENNSCSDEEDATEDADSEFHTNLGWADLVNKILKTNKAKGKKSLVLSKAKKLTDVPHEKKRQLGFEIFTESGETKNVEIVPNQEVKAPHKKLKKEVVKLRVKPTILGRDKERRLSKIATKGVVQLFNAVQSQQKDINTKLKEAGPLERKREKVLQNIDKRNFLDVLTGGNDTTVHVTSNKTKETNNEPSWRVLREDFMVGAKLRDWDRDMEEEEVEREEEVESN